MKNYTEIAVILDRSGSMSTIAADTIGGFNTFIEEQKKIPGEAKISVYQFDTEFESLCRHVDLKEVVPLSSRTFVPRGSTALYDAMGRTINELGTYLSNKPESERPDKVVLLVMTDGEENASKEFNSEQIKQIVKDQTEKFNWQILFIGSNQDAVLSAGKVGISSLNAMTFAHSQKGVQNAYQSLSSNIGGYRSGATMDASFSTADRDTQNKLLGK